MNPFDSTPIKLRLECGDCRQATDVSFSDDASVSSQSGAAAVWKCPRCGKGNALPAIGRIWSVTLAD